MLAVGASSGNSAPTTAKSGKLVLTVANAYGGPYATNLNPLSSGSPLTQAGNWSLVYETLLQFNFARVGQVTPWLASSYQWTNGSKSIKFTIRPGTKWSDGKPFTANDVAFTFNLLKRFPALNYFGVQFQSVSAPNGSTAIVNLGKLNFPSLYYIGSQPILPQHIWAGIKNPVTYLNPHPVGTGPFMVASITPQSLVFERNPLFRGPRPAMDQIVYPAYFTNAAGASAMVSGEAQWGDLFIASLKTYTGSGGGTHEYQYPPLYDISLIPNIKKYPLNLLPLRQAISDVVDRGAFARAADENQEPPITNPTGLILPRDKQFLAPQYRTLRFKVSVATAKATLTRGGFTYKGDRLYAPNGQRVSLTISVDGGFSDWVGGVPTLVENLKMLGIDAKMSAPSNTIFVSDLSTGNFELALWFPTTAGPGPFFQFDQMLNSANTAPLGKSAVQNYGRWIDPATDRYIAQYKAALTPKAQRAALYGIERVMVTKLPIIPLMYQVGWGQYETGTFTGWPSASNPYAIVYPYAAPSNELVVLHLRAAKP
jgi:peptide/nickel transport system substrate-binding protein